MQNQESSNKTKKQQELSKINSELDKEKLLRLRFGIVQFIDLNTQLVCVLVAISWFFLYFSMLQIILDVMSFGLYLTIHLLLLGSAALLYKKMYPVIRCQFYKLFMKIIKLKVVRQNLCLFFLLEFFVLSHIAYYCFL